MWFNHWDKIFAEGIAALGNTLYQLTWESNVVLRYQLDTLQKIDEKKLRWNLEHYKIFIPGKAFFVAIEWITLPYIISHERGKNTAFQNYSPAISFSNDTSKYLRESVFGNYNNSGKWYFFKQMIKNMRMNIFAIVKY